MNLRERTGEDGIRYAATAIAAVAIVACVLKEWQGLSRLHFLGYDYAFFYNAFRHVLTGQTDWHHLYNPMSEIAFLKAHGYPLDPHNHYVYPPQFAWLFAWLGLLPFAMSLALWRLMSLFAGVLGVYWTLKTLWPRIRRGHLLLAMGASLTLTPFQLDLAVGNVNTLLFALLAFAFYAIYRLDKPTLASAALAAAVLMKVTPIAVLFALALQRRWNVVLRALLMIALGLVGSCLWLGGDSTAQYALHFLQFGRESMGNGAAPYNQSLLGVLELLVNRGRSSTPPAWLSAFFDGYVLTLLLAFAFALKRRSWSTQSICIGLGAMLPLAVSPLVEQPHMVLTLPALIASFYILRRQPQASRRVYRALFAMAYALQTLPVTFLLNDATHWFPGLYWIHIQMFVSLASLLALLLTIAWRHPSERPAPRLALG
ncbi:glycosyltransferase family 87 protein [Alicyclobacillus vulcanalis]|uniref:DUF2029 domain-containing protein n=1 Tax=Alicyclobacillus vulcanalis TaxID=252246 RepID=A0A1N7NM59_9BACL|nr:glycosyltransferase family 87 protein [Alicyclobacillus vulcanalis]SIS99446.1 Protein of unknown function [Alicyclobacillus vulcanalis]